MNTTDGDLKGDLTNYATHPESGVTEKEVVCSAVGNCDEGISASILLESVNRHIERMKEFIERDYIACDHCLKHSILSGVGKSETENSSGIESRSGIENSSDVSSNEDKCKECSRNLSETMASEITEIQTDSGINRINVNISNSQEVVREAHACSLPHAKEHLDTLEELEIKEKQENPSIEADGVQEHCTENESTTHKDETFVKNKLNACQITLELNDKNILNEQEVRQDETKLESQLDIIGNTATDRELPIEKGADDYLKDHSGTSIFKNQSNSNSENTGKEINDNALGFNKIINIQDLKEISCEIVNDTMNSIHVDMTKVSDAPNVNKNNIIIGSVDSSFKTMPDVRIAINESIIRDKLISASGNTVPISGEKNCADNINITNGVNKEAFDRTSKSEKFLNDDIVSKNCSNQKEMSNFYNSREKEVDILKSVNTCKKMSDMSNLISETYLDEETICGFGRFRPQWIQKYATSQCYLILYSIIGILQGAYYSFLISCLSTLEKRFAFTSKISGSIMVADELTPTFLGILVGYFGGRAHRPRIVALGMLTTVVSCLITTFPYFIYGPAQHLNTLINQNTTGPEVCDSEVKKEMCGVDDRPPTMAAVLLLLLGSFMKGFGGMAYYAVGLSYMDDNSKKKNTPFYFAIAFALRLFGPTLGFLMSSAFLKINEDPFVDPGYGPEDPRWIGAWWMGFLLQGFLLLFFTVPLALFPRRLPNQRPLPKSHYGDDETWRQKFAGLFLALKRLSKNPLFFMLVLNTIMSILGSFGHYVMLPKYMENQFRLTASDASLYSGPPGLIAIQVATLVGGFIIWKCKPSSKLLTAGLALSEFIQVVGFLVLMIPKCENVKLSNIGLTAEGLILENQCNQNCLCTTAAFTPVCGPDGMTTYFNPCYAGCKQAITFNETQEFNNCSCVTDVTGNFVDAPSLVKGYCVDENCKSQAWAYIYILPTFHGITSILRVAHTMVLLRSIDPADKSIALGVFETFICLFGFIPYPILFGALIDSACLIWEKSCGQTGNCWFYDMDKFNYMIHGVSASFSTLSALCLVVVYFLSSRIRNLYEDEDLDCDVSVKSNKKESIDLSANAVTKM